MRIGLDGGGCAEAAATHDLGLFTGAIVCTIAGMQDPTIQNQPSLTDTMPLSTGAGLSQNHWANRAQLDERYYFVDHRLYA